MPEPDENTLFWQQSVETRLREFLKANNLHIPRPHTIIELREEVCGNNASKFELSLILQDFNKPEKPEWKNKLLSTRRRNNNSFFICFFFNVYRKDYCFRVALDLRKSPKRVRSR